MGGLSLWHWLVVIIVVLLLFGKGRISDMMGDIGKGLKSFKAGMAEEDKPGRPAEPRQLPRDEAIDIKPQAPPPADPVAPPPPPPTATPDEPPRS